MVSHWRIPPNEDGEGGQTWAAFAADTDMIRLAAEQEVAALRARNEALEAFVQRVIDDEELCVGTMAVSDYEAKYGLGSAAQLLGPLARALLGQDKA